jgi:hypothetical protein
MEHCPKQINSINSKISSHDPERSHLATNGNDVHSILKLSAADKGPGKLVMVKMTLCRLFI